MEPKYPDYTLDELEQWVINDEDLWWFIDRYELDNERDAITRHINNELGVH